ncbi:hypothetical protein [Lysinibacillus sp. RS5]|uniref:hypothetical protein n=1 Tax=unclassified Lysinibacillus TaxID=2636778 RepID=UPI0035BE1377
MHNQTIVQKAFIKIMEERVFQVAFEKANEDKLYIEYDNERRMTFELLNESLTTDRQRYLLNNLEYAWNFVERIMQEYAYRQGLQDSQMIHKEMNNFGIDVTKESMNITLCNKSNDL